MTDSDRSEHLAETLATAELSPSPEARERAAAAAGARVLMLADRRRRMRAGAALGLFALIGLSLTPPGRAVADRLGELVGIGEPSSVQEANLRDPRLTRSQELLGPVLVAASGHEPDGEPYEIVAWAAREKLDPDRPVPIDPETGEPVGGVPAPGEAAPVIACLGVVYPEQGEQETGKWCEGGQPMEEIVHLFSYGPAGLRVSGSDAGYVIIGITRVEVRRVEVHYTDPTSGSPTTTVATLGVLDEELQEATGAPYGFGYFVVFLPDDGAPRGRYPSEPSPVMQSSSITAFDIDGGELERVDVGNQYMRTFANQQATARLRERMEAMPRASTQPGRD